MCSAALSRETSNALIESWLQNKTTTTMNINIFHQFQIFVVTGGLSIKFLNKKALIYKY